MKPLAAASLVLALIPACAHAFWDARLAGFVLHDDNVSRARSAADRAGDFAVGASAALVHPVDSIETGSARVKLEAAGQRYLRYERASFASLTVATDYRLKLGLGPRVPAFSAQAALSREAAGESLRDAALAAASLGVSQRLGERTRATLGAAYDRRRQLHDAAALPGIAGTPFSVEGRSLFARASYALGVRTGVSAELRERRGDVESSTRPDPDILFYSSAVALDPAFGPDFIAYRVSGARTRSASGAFSLQLDRRASLEFDLSAERTEAAAGQGYARTSAGLYFLYLP